MEAEKLYLCDGNACDEYNKKYCYLHGGECRHTPHKEHAFSTVCPNFPPTKFIPFGASSVRFEAIDEESVFKKIKDGYKISMEKK